MALGDINSRMPGRRSRGSSDVSSDQGTGQEDAARKLAAGKRVDDPTRWPGPRAQTPEEKIKALLGIIDGRKAVAMISRPFGGNYRGCSRSSPWPGRYMAEEVVWDQAEPVTSGWLSDVEFLGLILAFLTRPPEVVADSDGEGLPSGL